MNPGSVLKSLSLTFIMLLSGCGIPDAIGNSVGQAIADVTTSMVACTASAVALQATPGMELEITKEAVADIFHQIESTGITKTGEFWSKIEPEMLTQLMTWIQLNYQQNSAFQSIDVIEFANALASGFIQAAEKQDDYGTYVFSKQLWRTVDGNKTAYFARLNLKVIDSTSQKVGAFGICDPGQ